MCAFSSSAVHGGGTPVPRRSSASVAVVLRLVTFLGSRSSAASIRRIATSDLAPAWLESTALFRLAPPIIFQRRRLGPSSRSLFSQAAPRGALLLRHAQQEDAVRRFSSGFAARSRQTWAVPLRAPVGLERCHRLLLFRVHSADDYLLASFKLCATTAVGAAMIFVRAAARGDNKRDRRMTIAIAAGRQRWRSDVRPRKPVPSSTATRWD